MSLPDDELGGLGPKERDVLRNLAAAGKPTVSVEDVVERLGVSRSYANQMLSRLQKKGWLQRVRRGVYTIVPLHSKTGQPLAEEPMAIAMAIFAPCYISGWTAAEFWDLTEQVANSLVVCTARTQRSRVQTVGRVKYRTRLTRDTDLGVTTVSEGSTRVRVADPHRLVLDILTSPELGGGGRQTLDIVRAYWRSEHAGADVLLAYAHRIGSGALFKRLGFTAERFASPAEHWLAECRERLTRGIALLDPAGPSRGKIVSRWNLKVNVPMPEQS
jgi:predicted transcriptional regulator of viral defense system